MLKLILILLVGVVFEAIGVVYLSRGLKQLGDVPRVTPAEIIRVVKEGITNPQIIAGVFFEALFFGCLLMLMSRSDVSFIWPLTALSFVFTTLAAKFFLHENISATRWAGVCLIMAGAALVTWSERARAPGAMPAATHGSTAGQESK
jgi:drug/metabolite transporter (DMT)-like permease